MHVFPGNGAPALREPHAALLDLAAAVLDSVAAAQGDAEAQYRLGDLHCRAPQAANALYDTATAAEFYRRAAAQGHATALCRLGDLLGEGQGVERDDAEAVKCYRIAAEKGDSYAQ